MKKIKFQLMCKQEKTIFDEHGDYIVVQEDALTDIETEYNENELVRIKEIAYKGKFTIEDDGVEENTTPTQLDIIEAQVTYTAMMTDTLLTEV